MTCLFLTLYSAAGDARGVLQPNWLRDAACLTFPIGIGPSEAPSLSLGLWVAAATADGYRREWFWPSEVGVDCCGQLVVGIKGGVFRTLKRVGSRIPILIHRFLPQVGSHQTPGTQNPVQKLVQSISLDMLVGIIVPPVVVVPVGHDGHDDEGDGGKK